MAQVKMLRKIGDNEQFSPDTEYLGGKKVRSTFSFRRDQNSDRYEKTVIFDFSGLTEDQLMELALANVRIKTQALIRNLDPAIMLNADSLASVDVLKDIVEAPTKGGDPQTAAIRSLVKAVGCSADEAREMINSAKAKADAKRPKAAKAA